MRVCVCLGPKAPLANYQVGEQSSGCVAPCSPRPPSLGATPPPITDPSVCCRESIPGTGFLPGVPGGHGEWRGGQVHLTATSAPAVLGAPLPLPYPVRPPLSGTPPDLFAQGQMPAPPGRPPTQVGCGARPGHRGSCRLQGPAPRCPGGSREEMRHVPALKQDKDAGPVGTPASETLRGEAAAASSEQHPQDAPVLA